GPGAPSVAEFAGVGVARVSLGSAVASAAYGLVGRAVRELASQGTYTAVDGGVGYGELNGLVSVSTGTAADQRRGATTAARGAGA
nr:hypothetical protein [Micromonospora sp. DSM 115978]